MKLIENMIIGKKGFIIVEYLPIPTKSIYNETI